MPPKRQNLSKLNQKLIEIHYELSIISSAMEHKSDVTLRAAIDA